MTDREFEALYREYFDPVYRYALGLTRDVHAAEVADPTCSMMRSPFHAAGTCTVRR